DQYVAIVQEKSVLRKTIFASQALIDRCMTARDGSVEILAEAEVILSKLADSRGKQGQWLNPGEVMQAYPGGLNGFLQPPNGGIGIPTPWTGVTTTLCG